MPNSELFRFSQITNFLHSIWPNKTDPPTITPSEHWCSNTVDQREGISLFYLALAKNEDTPSYVLAWEEDTGCSRTTSDWFCVFQRSFKGILNIFLIEASLKVLTRWYYVPSRLARICPGTSPLCFRGCEMEGSMFHI